jgi:ketosteroid isomerase-like protein
VELREIHPLGKSPVITEGDRIIAESGPSSTTSSAGTATACATCLDLRMAVRTVAALFPAAIETIRAGYWEILSRSIVTECHRFHRVTPTATVSTNTNRRPLMSDSYPLPTEPEGVIPSLVERFNSGKIEAMMALYAPEAVFVANDGRTITDRAEFTAILEHDIKLGLPLKANVRHVFVGGDTAQIVLDWSIDGTGPDGKIVHMHGTASDIMRRGADGRWRYIIDNNQGTAVRQPA